MIVYLDDELCITDKGATSIYDDADCLILTTSKAILSEYEYAVPLSSYLGITDKLLSLYDVWSFYFEGDISCDADMVKQLMDAFIAEKQWGYCFIVGYEVGWFRLTHNSIKPLGTVQFDCEITKYEIGSFVKRLRYALVKDGLSLKYITYYSYGNPFIESHLDKWYSLSDIFKGVSGVPCGSLQSMMMRLSTSISLRYGIKGVIDAIGSNVKALGMYDNHGELSCKYNYYKDFSVMTGSFSNSRNATFGIILDCEGVSGSDGSLKNGCREVGGIIFSELNGVLLPLYKFIADSLLFVDVMLNVVEVYRDVSDRVESKEGIPTYVYGASDKLMLESQIRVSGSRSSKRLRNKFRFIDVKHYIGRNIGNMEGRHTLQNIAKHFGVYSVKPKHNALSDARTLFNIISEICRRGDNINNLL